MDCVTQLIGIEKIRKCSKCSQPAVDNIKICQKCRENRKKSDKKLDDKRKKEGRCIECGGDNTGLCLTCPKCLVKKMSVRATGNINNYKMLLDIFKEQKGICPYSGDLMVIGINASIDHKVPTSKGGDNSRTNLQWTTKISNTMKHNQSEDEMFYNMRKIIAYQDSKK
jgi:CRISPR/Cas system Type II protein with McrA/HNH and RuvC-like nuclease domain